MSLDRFIDRMNEVSTAIASRDLDEGLQEFLNELFPGSGKFFDDVDELCRQGREEGWLCGYSAGGLHYGRVVKPGEIHGRLSVDVVLMDDLAGPHHRHTTGEIGMIIPQEPEAKFDGMGRGWYVYPPGSAHRPTVTDGAAYVVYLLPDGQIEFTK